MYLWQPGVSCAAEGAQIPSSLPDAVLRVVAACFCSCLLRQACHTVLCLASWCRCRHHPQEACTWCRCSQDSCHQVGDRTSWQHQRTAPTPVCERSPRASQPVARTEQVAVNTSQGQESASSPTGPFCMCVILVICVFFVCVCSYRHRDAAARAAAARCCRADAPGAGHTRWAPPRRDGAR